jgi:hypothetical protein
MAGPTATAGLVPLPSATGGALGAASAVSPVTAVAYATTGEPPGPDNWLAWLPPTVPGWTWVGLGQGRYTLAPAGG